MHLLQKNHSSSAWLQNDAWCLEVASIVSLHYVVDSNFDASTILRNCWIQLSGVLTSFDPVYTFEDETIFGFSVLVLSDHNWWLVQQPMGRHGSCDPGTQAEPLATCWLQSHARDVRMGVFLGWFGVGVWSGVLVIGVWKHTVDSVDV